MTELTQKRLREVFLYIPETGEFYRKISTSNCVRAGERCGYNDGNGYIQLQIDGNQYRAHRLAWLYMTGELPCAKIDHINQSRSDNRFSNLRLVSDLENSRNNRLSKNNKSGFTGVSWDKRKNKWYAYIAINGKTISLGTYKNLDEAVEKRLAANIEYGFHENHGNPGMLQEGV